MTTLAESPESLATEAPAPAGRKEAVVACFVASGAAGLIYQVCWSRELVLVFGNTTQAIATIVTAFMLGLGAGGLLGARLARGRLNPLRGYALCELGVAAFALALPAAFGAIAAAYQAAYVAGDPTLLALVRFALALVAVTPATLLMGITLPLLTRYCVRRLGEAGPGLARLYAANTLGAVLGTVAAGFVLIELLGLQGTTWVAVALNLLAGGTAGVLSFKFSVLNEDDQMPDGRGGTARLSNSKLKTQNSKLGPRHVVLVASAVSGFTSLALEVLWTRMLAEGTGSSIYIFVIILTLFLLGIAAGSAAYERWGRPARDTLTVLGLGYAATGLVAAGTVVLGSGAIGTWPVWARGVIVLPATLLMGYTFPLSGRLLVRRAQEAGSSTGLLYAWNTGGAIGGSFAAAFVLAPTIGTNRAILGLAVASLVLGAWLVLVDPRRVRPRPALAAAALVLAALVGGAALTDLPLTRTLTQNLLAGTGRPTTHLEDSLATVDSVGGPPAERQLLVSGVGMTNLTVDTRLMAYLPLILRPQESRFLVICFGMGSAYRSGLIAGLDTTAVELSPSVPGQMPVFFPDAAQFLTHPHGRVVIADGRNYVRLSPEQYDAIVVDPPPPPESAGTVVLYTQEFLAQGRARLRPGGVFLLWIPYVGETVASFQDHLRTFAAVFPHVQAVFGLSPYGVFVFGSDAPLAFADDRIAAVLGTPAAQADLAGAPDFPPTPAAAWPAVLRGQLWLADAQVTAFAGPGPLISDDRPRTEYWLLRTLFQPPSPQASRQALAGSR